MFFLEHFSIECCKTKTKVITTANQNKGKFHKEPMRIQSEYVKQPQLRESVSNQVEIGFSFASDWLRGWHKFSKPITERSRAKPMQSLIYF